MNDEQILTLEKREQLQKRVKQKTKNAKKKAMECSSIVSITTFGPGDLGSNPGWFAVSNFSQNLSSNTLIIQGYD